MDGKEAEAKSAAENFINSLSAEEFANLKGELLDKLAATAKQEGDKLAALQSRKQEIDAEIAELWEKEKSLTDYKEKSPIFSRRQDLNEESRYLAMEIMNQQNVAECLLNGGDFVSFTDKKGTRHERLPYYSPINTDIIGFDENNILCSNKGKANQIKSLNLDGEILVLGDGYTDYEIKEEGVETPEVTTTDLPADGQPVETPVAEPIAE